MISRSAPTLFTARSDQLPIETTRAIATLLLVAYHVIGAGPHAGLQIDYPSDLRLFADFLLDLRMPLFAMIAGLVFAMKPLSPSGLPHFFAGKVRRLVVPGIVAMLAFEIAGSLGHTQLDVKSHYLQPFVTGYAHFWFLQSVSADLPCLCPIGQPDGWPHRTLCTDRVLPHVPVAGGGAG